MKNLSVLALDFLSISIDLQKTFFNQDCESFNFGKTRLILTNRKTFNFKKIYDIEINGLKFGELRTQTNKKTLPPGHSVIKFSNELLYCGQLYTIYKRLKRDLSFKFLKINQIDIALDQTVYKDDNSHLKWAYDYMSGKVDFIGSQNIRIDSKHHKIRDVYIGQRQSGKFMRCYYKKQELNISNKTYIQEFWNLNNLDSENEVFRSELSLSGSIMNKIYSPDFSENEKNVYLPFLEEKTMCIIQNSQFLHSVFYRETKDFCKTVKTKELKEKKRTNLCKQSYIFKTLKTTPVFLLDRIKGEASKMVHKIKMCAKLLSQIAIETGQNIYEDLSNELVNFEDLILWKDRQYIKWYNEHKNKISNPIYKKYMSNFNIFAHVQLTTPF